MLEALREQEISDVFDLRDNGTEAEGFPAIHVLAFIKRASINVRLFFFMHLFSYEIP
ncbi:hypothetical protein HPL003_03560 [Paenibacillus terrae HPL-003]|uniref:Uncharacterized protein n=1 Tax=Paenibacillus terrae (strain HPL-003) TaxID=985665 RepID=G7VT71_PAETH|nr:hypothetical protein HPL003_03560 [Paenibacillus terrae HPL-003]